MLAVLQYGVPIMEGDIDSEEESDEEYASEGEQFCFVAWFDVVQTSKRGACKSLLCPLPCAPRSCPEWSLQAMSCVQRRAMRMRMGTSTRRAVW